MAAFPPQRVYKATALSHSEAQTWITTYLSNCESNPLLQPDALLTASGPTQAQGMSSLVIHNLRRLHSGLNGQYDIEPLAGISRLEDKSFKGAVVNVDDIYAEQDWQDKSEFEREQSVEMGEVGTRDEAAGGVVGSDVKNAVNLAASGGIDRLARKKAKKEKQKQAKKDRKAKSQD